MLYVRLVLVRNPAVVARSNAPDEQIGDDATRQSERGAEDQRAKENAHPDHVLKLWRPEQDDKKTNQCADKGARDNRCTPLDRAHPERQKKPDRQCQQATKKISN